MTRVLSGTVNNRMLKRLLKAYDKRKPDDKLIIYLKTEGGNTSIQSAIIEFINEHAQDIVLVAYESIFSAGFNIFFHCKCERKITHNTTGMVHYSSAPINIDESGKPVSDYDENMLSFVKGEKTNTLKFLKNLGLTEEELKSVKESRELYFSYDRLCELLKNQNG